VLASPAMLRLARWLRRRFTGENRWHVAAMVAVLLVSFAVRLDHIALSLPYPRHVDEETWVNISLRMLREGSANPKRFNKPSLPVYLLTAAFSAGLAGAKVAGTANSAKDLGDNVNDYYRLPGAAFPAKTLYAFSSIVALACAGFVGFAITRRASLLWLTPLLAAISDSYFEFSWSYMNVDILGAGFGWATLAYLFHQHSQGRSFASGPGALRRVVVLGVLSGLTVGCKYNLFPILVPGALWFVLFDRRRWFLHLTLLGLVAVGVFFLTTPYALITTKAFLTALRNESYHYSHAHPGKTPITPGLPMLWLHLRLFVDAYGWIPYLLSALGAVLLFLRNWKLATLLFAWPLCFVGYMSLQRVFFDRNDVAVHLFVALALGVALLELPARGVAWVAAFRPTLPSRQVGRALTALLALIVVVTLPWKNVAAAYSRRIEPRNDAIQWLRREKAPGGVLVVDPGFELDYRRVERRLRVLVLEPKRNAAELRSLLAKEPHVSIITTDMRKPLYQKTADDLRVRVRFTRYGQDRGFVILER
jgi:hypothetical protein